MERLEACLRFQHLQHLFSWIAWLHDLQFGVIFSAPLCVDSAVQHSLSSSLNLFFLVFFFSRSKWPTDQETQTSFSFQTVRSHPKVQKPRPVPGKPHSFQLHLLAVELHVYDVRVLQVVCTASAAPPQPHHPRHGETPPGRPFPAGRLGSASDQLSSWNYNISECGHQERKSRPAQRQHPLAGHRQLRV